MSLKRAANNGLEDVSPMLSPTSGVRTEIPVPAVKVIREIGTPSFSISLTAPLGQGELPSSSRISNLPGTLTSERSETDEGDRPLAPAAFSTQYCYLTLLLPTVDGLEQGRVDFELSLSREKAELLQRLSDSCASSSKREEALRTELVGLRRAMREAADSFAAEKRGLEEARTGLTLRVAELSAVPAFPGDPVLARRCIGWLWPC
ncbi:hypothetical protein CJ030_MR1G011837 [Morella rubra]|uniref:Uncharacterized protein n=1 Tax=Morella rubra TaxID=262757 RepID=A0A6A1WVZ7_9ROSI|nr:hypothetical protein CJ030_MR1G011837 [Morella rubra]